MTTIGFIGLGTMGGRIAGRLLEQGHTVHGYNRSPARAADLVERGLILHGSPREVAAAADVVFSMVTDGAALEAITAGPDGILAGLKPRQVYVDMSTVAPDTSRALAGDVHDLGAVMLDAPVSGSAPAAEQGTLMIMVGGDRGTFERVEPLLHEIGTTVTHVGQNGAALVMKLAVNISLAAQILAFSEGVLLAERGGIDRAVAVSVLTGSAERLADAEGARAVLPRSAGYRLVLDRPDGKGSRADAQDGRTAGHQASHRHHRRRAHDRGPA